MNKFSFMKVTPSLPLSLTQGFLLVEPAVTDHEPFLQTLSMRPCTPRVLTHREELMPRLIDLSSLDPDEQENVGDMLLREVTALRPPVVCAWLACDAEIDELALHVAQLLVGPGADGRPVFWRFYDPRVLAITLAVLDPAQRMALLGPVTEWQFAWAGHRWTVAVSGAPSRDADAFISAFPGPDQWSRINRSDVANRVIDRLPAMSADRTAQLPYELDRIFTDAIHRGGLSDTDSLADYAWHCIRYGPAFEQHPLLLDAWPALARRETHWSEVLSRFTPDVLQGLESAPRQPQT